MSHFVYINFNLLLYLMQIFIFLTSYHHENLKIGTFIANSLPCVPQ